MKEDETLAPIVAIRAVNFYGMRDFGNGTSEETIRYEIQFRRQGSEDWEMVPLSEIRE